MNRICNTSGTLLKGQPINYGIEEGKEVQAKGIENIV
jgi:hypothetical protein